MAEDRTFGDRLFMRLFAIPALAQLWAKATSGRTRELVDLSDEIPFVRLDKPLSACTGALLTTGGIHLIDQAPFDMENPNGDASYRLIPREVSDGQITITHKYYDHRDADADINVIFPLDPFRDVVDQGVVGALAPDHFGFMGHIKGEEVGILTQTTAPEVAAKLRDDGVDFAFLTPA